MTQLTAHVSGVASASELALLQELEAKIAELLVIINELEDKVKTLGIDVAKRFVFDVEAAESGFRIADSNGDPAGEFQEEEPYLVYVPWHDWAGNYAHDTTDQTIPMTASAGSLTPYGVADEGVKTYLFVAPIVASDTPITFTMGKYTDASLTTSLMASVTVMCRDVVPVSATAEMTLSRSGNMITARVQTQVNAACYVYWRLQGDTDWTLRTPFEPSTKYGVSPPHVQSFAAPVGIIEVYATDNDTYTTPVSTISVPASASIDLTGFIPFLDVGTQRINAGDMTTAQYNDMTEPLPNYYGEIFPGSIVVNQIDGHWSIGGVMTPTPNGIRGSARIQSAHNTGRVQELFVFQRFRIPSGMDWGGEFPAIAGTFGQGIFGGSEVSYSESNPNGFAIFPIWRGMSSGGAELGIYEYGADQIKSYGDAIIGSKVSSFNSGTARLLSSGWHSLMMRVKMNTSTTASDGIVEFWHNGEKIYSRTERQLMSGGIPGIESIRMQTVFGGVNSAQLNYAPSKSQTIYMRDWMYKTV